MYFILIVICVLLLVLFYEWYQGNKHLPPGPWGIPVLGVLPFENFEDQHAYQIRIKQKYGPLVCMKIGEKLVVYLLDYETVHEAFEKQPETFAGRFDFLPLNLGRHGLGIVMQQGEKWQTARRFVHTTLRDFGMGKQFMEAKIHDEVNSFCRAVIDKSGGNPFLPCFSSITSNVISRIIFGHRFEREEQFTEFQTVSKSIFKRRVSILTGAFISWIKYFPQFKRDAMEINQDLKCMWTLIEEMIENSKSKFGTEPTNFLGALLHEANSGDDKHDLYYERIPDGTVNTMTQIIAQLFNGGTETTATALEWAFAALIKFPNLQLELQTEISDELGDELPSYEHRFKLKLCHAFCMEVQRFGNIAATAIPHETTEDTWLSGYFIPKGTVVLAGMCAIMNDTNYFKNPNEFNPYRFIKKDGTVNQRPISFMPFSAGKRMCPGDTLAKCELFICVTDLLQKYTFHAPKGEIPNLIPVYEITTHPEKYRMIAVARRK